MPIRAVRASSAFGESKKKMPAARMIPKVPTASQKLPYTANAVAASPFLRRSSKKPAITMVAPPKKMPMGKARNLPEASTMRACEDMYKAACGVHGGACQLLKALPAPVPRAILEVPETILSLPVTGVASTSLPVAMAKA